MVDWGFAKATARRLVPAGPSTTATELASLVGGLRQGAVEAVEPVAETARMAVPVNAPPALVVDRPRWVDANIDTLAAMLDPVIAHVTASRALSMTPAVQAVGGKVTGGEAGALMAYVAGKVLGQYDLAPGGTPRLLLVAPNVLQAERELGVDPRDFRLWICLHEQTHLVQFTAVPWLREHVIERAQALATDLVPDPAALRARIDQLGRALPEVLRGGAGVSEALLTPEQRTELAGLTAVMSLLEGHADVVMDEVGPTIVPSVKTIRARFDQRRKGVGSIDRLLRRLLGLEAKMRQYRDGAIFVRAVFDKVGVDGFNAVWTSPDTLPTAAEIESPRDWVTRVHG